MKPPTSDTSPIKWGIEAAYAFLAAESPSDRQLSLLAEAFDRAIPDRLTIPADARYYLTLFMSGYAQAMRAAICEREY